VFEAEQVEREIEQKQRGAWLHGVKGDREIGLSASLFYGVSGVRCRVSGGCEKATVTHWAPLTSSGSNPGYRL
jgi:hypothetical protein